MNSNLLHLIHPPQSQNHLGLHHLEHQIDHPGRPPSHRPMKPAPCARAPQCPPQALPSYPPPLLPVPTDPLSDKAFAEPINQCRKGTAELPCKPSRHAEESTLCAPLKELKGNS